VQDPGDGSDHSRAHANAVADVGGDCAPPADAKAAPVAAPALPAAVAPESAPAVPAEPAAPDAQRPKRRSPLSLEQLAKLASLVRLHDPDGQRYARKDAAWAQVCRELNACFDGLFLDVRGAKAVIKRIVNAWRSNAFRAPAGVSIDCIQSYSEELTARKAGLSAEQAEKSRVEAEDRRLGDALVVAGMDDVPADVELDAGADGPPVDLDTSGEARRRPAIAPPRLHCSAA